MVCLGGYGTHWVPSVQLDELCVMLWDMARYHNYDIRSPYNRDAALWVANQTTILFPTDPRPLRDLRAAQGRKESKTTEGSRKAFGGRSQWPRQAGIAEGKLCGIRSTAGIAVGGRPGPPVSRALRPRSQRAAPRQPSSLVTAAQFITAAAGRAT